LSPYLPPNVEGRYNAVWSGTEMLLLGPMDMAYNPVTRRWRKLALGGGGSAVVVWTGRYVLLWGGGCCGGYENTGSLYEPATDTWRSMPPSPLSAREADGVWTGQELIIVGGTAEGVAFADAAAYNPATGTWRLLPRLPAPRMYSTLTWTGTEVLVVGGQRQWDQPYEDALAYRPTTNTWRRLQPMEISRVHHVAAWTGHQLLVWGGRSVPYDQHTDAYTAPHHGLAYDPTTNTWTALPRAPLGARTNAFAAWTGTEMLVWGGQSVTDPHRALLDGAAYRP
jgi:N-acetylneuraminic acid mutarotase